MSKLLNTICSILGLLNFKTTAYHFQANEQVEQYYRTLIATLGHYVAEHQREWDIFVPPAMHAYITEVGRLTATTRISSVLSSHFLHRTIFNRTSALPTGPYNGTASSVIRSKLLHFTSTTWEKTDWKLIPTPRRYQDHHNRCARVTILLQT